jgi:hypothetical protein
MTRERDEAPARVGRYTGTSASRGRIASSTDAKRTSPKIGGPP